MKIILINNLYRPFERGGAERVVENIAEKLKDEKDQVSIITTKPYFNKQNNTLNGIKIFYLSGLFYNLKNLPKFIKIFWHIFDIFDIITALKVKYILKKENPDLVITNNLTGLSLLIPLIVKSLKIIHIHILHDIQLLHPSGLLIFGKEKIVKSVFAIAYQKICKILFEKVNFVISPSRWLLDEHLRRNFFLSSKKEVMPNPISFLEKKERLDINKNKKFKYLYVGQIEDHKGVLILVNIFLKFNKIYSNTELIIIGDGSKFYEAKSLIKENRSIIFLGKLDYSKVNKNMEEANCLVVPSLCYENSPSVIYEAAQVNLPVIASNLGGIPEMVNIYQELLFNPGNENDLFNKMVYVFKNYSEIIKNNLKIDLAELSVDNYISKFKSIIFTKK